MKPPTIVGFDAAERTVTLQFAEDIRDRGFTIGAEFGCARNQTSTQFCHEAEEKAHLLAKAREEIARLRDGYDEVKFAASQGLGREAQLRAENAALREEVARITAERDAARAMLDPWREAAAECAKERCARKELQQEVARLNQRILDDNKAYGCELRDPAGTIWDHAAQLQQEVVRLLAALKDIGKVKWAASVEEAIRCGGNTPACAAEAMKEIARAAIDAAKGGAK